MPDDVKQIRHEIARIRKKLGDNADQVETIRNIGYRYRALPGAGVASDPSGT